MNFILRQSTAGQEVPLGPFLDDTDGKTAETALAIANTDIKIFKSGATAEVSKNSGGATHIASGRYYCVLDATDTNTLGSGELNVHVAGALPVKVRFTVLPSNVYDSIVAGTDKLQVDVAEFGNATGTFSSGRPEVNTTHAAGTAWGSGAITANSIANGAITSAKFGAGALDSVWSTGTRTLTAFAFSVTVGTNNDKTGYSLAATPPTAEEISTQVAADLATAHGSGSWQTATGFAVAGDAMTLTAAYDAAKTAATQASVDAIDGVVDAIFTDTGTTIPATLVTIKSVTDKLDFTLEADLGVFRFTANALEQAPTGGGSAPTAADVAAEVNTVLTAAHGSGSWQTATGFSTHNAADVVTALGNGNTLTAVPWNTAWDAEVQSEVTDALNVYGGPTNAQMEARTLAAAEYATAAGQTTILNRIGAFTGSGINNILGFLQAIMSKDAGTPSDVGGSFSPATDALEAIRNRGDAAWTGGGGGGGVAGSGSSAYTPILRTGGGTPLGGVKVWFTTDEAGDNVVAGTLTTDAFGEVTANLDAGTYYMHVQKSGYNPSSTPIAVTVDATPSTVEHDIFSAASAASTSLAITYSEIRRQLGLHLSWDRDADNWSVDEVADANEIIRQGLRQFYWPMLEGGGTHVWSFLCPVAELAVEAGESTYALPNDFGVMVGDKLTFSAGANFGYVERIAEDELRALLGNDDLEGPPKYFAVRVKPTSAGAETAYELLLYPKPNAAATLTYRYQIEPSTIDASSTYPLGGSVHAQTVLESCLAAAERILEDTNDGAHYKAFQMQLAASIELDKQSFSL